MRTQPETRARQIVPGGWQKSPEALQVQGQPSLYLSYLLSHTTSFVHGVRRRGKETNRRGGKCTY